MGKSTLIGASVLAAAMFMAVSAQAGKPAPFENCNYFVTLGIPPEFKEACHANDYVKKQGWYVGSCAPENGKCDDSVDNKLRSALNKYLNWKPDDALEATCAIYSDADTWANTPGKKQKLLEDGFDHLTEAVDALAGFIKEGAKCSP